MAKVGAESRDFQTMTVSSRPERRGVEGSLWPRKDAILYNKTQPDPSFSFIAKIATVFAMVGVSVAADFI